jgi:hypothetical protein
LIAVDHDSMLQQDRAPKIVKKRSKWHSAS